MKRTLPLLCVISMLAAALLIAPTGRPARADETEKGDTDAPTPIADQYRDTANRIIHATMEHNDAWGKMEHLCDDIGHRLSGSPQLEEAVTWAAEAMRADGQENVRLEKVMVPHWVRGEESLELVSPRRHPMTLLGLGGSVGTPPEGITAEVIVVEDEDELKEIGEGASGKIVLFNNAMPEYDPAHGTGYGTTVRFRTNGARLAAEQGALAALVRSVTAHSLNTPHTGAMRKYEDDQKKIPAAAIAVEDATLLSRLCERDKHPKVTLKMGAQTLPDAESANVVGELRGREKPEEVVVIGGHIDAWDVGSGAHDDGGGCVTAMEAINVLRKLGLTPRRTIRVVLWTNEENGLRGGVQYAEDHADELKNHVAAIEMDSGVFQPTGYSVQCADAARQERGAEQMRDIITLLEPIGADTVRTGFSGADISRMKDGGVMLMGHMVDVSTYFNYHHSPADTLDKVDPEMLSKNVAAMATVAYILADMPDRFGE